MYFKQFQVVVGYFVIYKILSKNSKIYIFCIDSPVVSVNSKEFIFWELHQMCLILSLSVTVIFMFIFWEFHLISSPGYIWNKTSYQLPLHYQEACHDTAHILTVAAIDLTNINYFSWTLNQMPNNLTIGNDHDFITVTLWQDRWHLTKSCIIARFFF